MSGDKILAVKKTTKLMTIFVLTFLLSLLVIQTVNADVAVGNSENWVDVYSVLLSQAEQGQRAFFLNSDSITALTKIMSKDQPVKIYESKSDPFINNLQKQLNSVGYDASLAMSSNNLNLDLDPKTGKYFVISQDNPRISISVAAIAVKEHAWVLVVNDDNVDDVVKRLQNANEVVGVGNFKRTLLQKLKPTFTKYVHNKDIFEDSRELVKLQGVKRNIILADGSFLENEFFLSKNPVLLSGHNKILDDTFKFLEDNNIKSVVIVGNELSVIGEQIRDKSNKTISVFVKFGQSDTVNSGRVYALTMFPLPKPKLALTVTSAIYDPKNKDLIATFENLGNAGIYELSTITVKDKDGNKIGEGSNEDAIYLAAGEKLPVSFAMDLPIDKINGSNVEFYTSFGLYPSELDTFLTMRNKHGPPFSIPLTKAEIEGDNSTLDVMDVFYYTGLKRIGVHVKNNGSETTYYNIKINGVIVTGLEKDLFKADYVKPHSEKTTYLPVELDKLDLEENTEFNIVVTYGKDKDMLLKNLNLKIPFATKSGGLLTGLVTGITGDSSATPLIILLILIALGLIGYFVVKSKSSKETKVSSKKKKTATKKKTAKKTTKKKSTKKTRKK